jgi:hypothetical protein
MNAEFDNPLGVDERTELLISRSLDGELTAEESFELDVVLRANPAARRLLEEYERVDRLTVTSMRQDLLSGKSATMVVATGRFRSLRLAAAGAVLAAAAVIALAFIPDFLHTGGHLAMNRPVAVQPMVGQTAPGGPQQFVDYREGDFLPQRRQRGIVRDLIGVRGKNQKNQDVIYIFERNTQSTRITPISGDF